MKPAQQLTLWDDTREEGIISAPVTYELDVSIWQRCEKSPLKLSRQDTDAMRAWLLKWGKRNGWPGFSFPFSRNDPVDRRYGLVYATEARWKQDMQPPYNGQQEWYAGEWLVKCIEQVRRYDAGEKIPWFEFDLGKTNAQTRTAEEE